MAYQGRTLMSDSWLALELEPPRVSVGRLAMP